MTEPTVKDKNGDPVSLGDIVRVIKLPNVDSSKEQMREVETMLGGEFVVESLEHGCVEVTKWWEAGSERRCHSLFLFSDEFELVTGNDAS